MSPSPPPPPPSSSSPSPSPSRAASEAMLRTTQAPPQPQSVSISPRHDAKVRQLRAHNLVSNSPFNKYKLPQFDHDASAASSADATVNSVPGSPSPRQRTSSRTYRFSPNPAPSPSRGKHLNPVDGQLDIDPERIPEEQEFENFQQVKSSYVAPRKSQSYKKLQTASYVSNSPFKSDAPSDLAAHAEVSESSFSTTPSRKVSAADQRFTPSPNTSSLVRSKPAPSRLAGLELTGSTSPEPTPPPKSEPAFRLPPTRATHTRIPTGSPSWKHLARRTHASPTRSTRPTSSRIPTPAASGPDVFDAPLPRQQIPSSTIATSTDCSRAAWSEPTASDDTDATTFSASASGMDRPGPSQAESQAAQFSGLENDMEELNLSVDPSDTTTNEPLAPAAGHSALPRDMTLTGLGRLDDLMDQVLREAHGISEEEEPEGSESNIVGAPTPHGARVTSIGSQLSDMSTDDLQRSLPDHTVLSSSPQLQAVQWTNQQDRPLPPLPLMSFNLDATRDAGGPTSPDEEDQEEEAHTPEREEEETYILPATKEAQPHAPISVAPGGMDTVQEASFDRTELVANESSHSCYSNHRDAPKTEAPADTATEEAPSRSVKEEAPEEVQDRSLVPSPPRLSRSETKKSVAPRLSVGLGDLDLGLSFGWDAPSSLLASPSMMARPTQHDWLANGSSPVLRAASPPAGLRTPAEQADAIIARRRMKHGLPVKPRRSLSVGALPEGFTAPPISTQTRGGEADITSGSDKGLPREDQEEESDENQGVSPEEEGVALARPPQETRKARDGKFLTGTLVPQEDQDFGAGLQRELSVIAKKDRPYRMRKRQTIKAGDVDEEVPSSPSVATEEVAAESPRSNKGWRKARRSDMKEYAEELAEYRRREDPRQATGKVFVRVESFTPAEFLPIPTSQPTRFDLFLNNGINEVKAAGGGRLVAGQAKAMIGQEFELLQHKGLQFNLTLRVIKDAHLQPQTMQIPVPAMIPSPRDNSSFESIIPTSRAPPPSPKKEKLISRIFGSPKKSKHASSPSRDHSYSPSPPVVRTVTRPPEPILAFINREGDLARAHVAFEQQAEQMLGQVARLDLPLMGVLDPPRSLSEAHGQRRGMGMMGANLDPFDGQFTQNLAQPRGTLQVSMFFVPSVPGLEPLVPARLSECVEAMDLARSETVAQHAGILTQSGGDCGKTWRRRWVELRGGTLICRNEVTHKEVARIFLASAEAVEESSNPLSTPTLGSASGAEDEDFYEVERSFRLRLRGGDILRFFTDTDEEKARWMHELRAAMGTGGGGARPTPEWARNTLAILNNFQQGTLSLPDILAPPRRPRGLAAPEAPGSPAAPLAGHPQQHKTQPQLPEVSSPPKRSMSPPRRAPVSASLKEEPSDTATPDRDMAGLPPVLPSPLRSTRRLGALPRPQSQRPAAVPFTPTRRPMSMVNPSPIQGQGHGQAVRPTSILLNGGVPSSSQLPRPRSGVPRARPQSYAPLS